MKQAFIVLVTLSLNLAASPQYNQKIKPLIDKYCVSCHGPKTQKAKLRMDHLNPDLINGDDTEMWQEVLDLINTSEI